MMTHNLKKALEFLQRYSDSMPMQDTAAQLLKKAREFLQRYRVKYDRRKSSTSALEFNPSLYGCRHPSLSWS